jgi:hypothetical protein
MPRERPGKTPRVKKTQEKPEGVITNSKGGGALPGPGPGRPKGSRNKFSGELKAMILEALANSLEGGDAVEYLISQAQQANPSPFMSRSPVPPRASAKRQRARRDPESPLNELSTLPKSSRELLLNPAGL